MRARGALFLTGNTERLVLGASDERHAWALERLSPEQRDFVGGWPATVELHVEGLGRVLFCHGSPRSDEEILTAATPDAVVAAALAGVDADVVVGGHTHHQFDRVVDGIRLVNAGSVGLPYEGERGAFWTLLGPDVEPRRTDYDVEAAVELLVASGLAGADELLRDSLLQPLPREDAVAEFERLAGRDP
jgi:predicted phosphodiesterase